MIHSTDISERSCPFKNTTVNLVCNIVAKISEMSYKCQPDDHSCYGGSTAATNRTNQAGQDKGQGPGEDSDRGPSDRRLCDELVIHARKNAYYLQSPKQLGNQLT